ncbi:FHA domain-containing protein [Rhodopirellula bahusiensis]|uniref:FHA domain-containing protein n=1 Tax=Rhodopirellula bahusiensis TaxID=2014065 RepID=UPI003263A9DF
MKHSQEPQLRIRLSPLAGVPSGTPKSIKVHHLPFCIGRSKDCDMTIRRSTISRSHCVLTLQDGMLHIADLGSRRGTLVDGSRLEVKTAVPLSHNQRIQLDKIVLRVSVRNRLTNEPIVSEAPAKSSPLLSELDSLLDEIEQGNLTNEHSETESADKQTKPTLKKQKSPLPIQPSVSESEEDSSDSENNLTDTTELATSTEDTVVSEDATPIDTTRTDPNESGPKRLPDHIRKRLTQDSQEAAKDALKRLFGGR